MSFKKLFIPLLLVSIPLFFFYKTLFFGQIPFPGDLLLGNYDPYRSNTVAKFPEGVPHKGQGADVIRQAYPWKIFSIDSIKNGVFPLWNPYVFSGNTHLANLQSGVFYPLNILFFVLPFIDAWTVYIVLQYIFLFVFTYLYLRQIKLGTPASLLGAAAFSFSGFLTVWAEYGIIGHTMYFLPCVFFLTEKIFSSNNLRWYFLLALSIACSIFTGYIQLSLYMLLLLGAYVLFHFFAQKKRTYRKYIQLALSVVGGLLISSVQLIPLHEVLSLSLRSTYSYSVLLERLMPPENIITFLVPDFFGNSATGNYFLQGGSNLERAAFIGVWPLVFGVFAIFSKKTFIKNFFAIVALVTLIFVISFPPVAYFHSIGIPFLSTGIPTRALSILCFCLAVLGAIGADAYLRGDILRKKKIIVLCVFVIIFVSLWAITYLLPDPRFAVSRRNLIIPTAIFGLGSVLIMLKIQKKIIISVILLITILELFYSFQKFNSFVPRNYIYPKNHITQKLREIQGIDRFWGYGSANIDTNFQIIEKIYGTDGYDPLFSKRYGEFISASKNGKIPSVVPRSVANIHPGYGVNELKQNPFRQRALDITGVKYVLNIKGTKGIDSAFSKDTYGLLWEENGWQIYNNKNVLERVVLFGDYIVHKNNQDVLKTLYAPSFKFQETLILEKDISPLYSIRADPDAQVTVLQYRPNEIIIETRSSRDQLLFISDNYFPGWRATVDGKNVDILRANYTFRAVPLKKGSHVIVMSYLPASFVAGAIITTAALLGLLGIAIFVTISTRHNKKHKSKSK